MNPMLKTAKKLIVLVIGSTVVLIGVIMIITPGPALIVIPVGLGILATEFVWARRLLKKLKEEGTKIGESVLKGDHNSKGKNSHHDAA